MLLLDRVLHLCLIAANERRTPSQQDVSYYTDSPDIDFTVICLLRTQFWCHIKRTSKRKIQFLTLVTLSRKSKIRQLDPDLLIIDVGILLNENILRF